MTLKPTRNSNGTLGPGCRGCPFESRSAVWVPPDRPERPVCWVVGQNPGAAEEAAGSPLVGPSGAVVWRDLAPRAGLTREAVAVDNAIRCRIEGTNTLPSLTSTEVQAAIVHCHRAHGPIEPPRRVVTLGEYAAWAWAGVGGPGASVSLWRGATLPLRAPGDPVRLPPTYWTPGPADPAVFVTLHPAAWFRDPALTIPMRRDWHRIRDWLAGTWPRPLPSITRQRPPDTLTGRVAVDTEFAEHQPAAVYRYSVASEAGVWVVDPLTRADWPRWNGRPAFVVQSADADLPWLIETGVTPADRVDDTMLAHAVLWGGAPHDLNYLGSLYTPYNRWKHLAETDPIGYSALDAAGTLAVWEALRQEFDQDPASARLYETTVQPLIWVIRAARAAGVRVLRPRARRAAQALADRVARAMIDAQAAAGWPINPGSDVQVRWWLYRGPGAR